MYNCVGTYDLPNPVASTAPESIYSVSWYYYQGRSDPVALKHLHPSFPSTAILYIKYISSGCTYAGYTAEVNCGASAFNIDTSRLLPAAASCLR